jgi:drug/metabolite transporter (DMT)-like permease
VLALAISLVASVSWGSTDFLAGLASRRVSVPVVLIGVEGIGLIIIAAVIAVTGEGPPPVATLLQGALAGACGVTGLGLFFYALTLGKMGVVAPVASCGAALPAIVGVAGGDPFSGLLAVGLLATFAGIVLISFEAEHEEQEHHTQKGGRAVVFALLAALGFGGYYVFFDGVADQSVPWGLVAARGLPVLVLAAVVLLRRLEPPRGGDRGLVVGAGVLDITATTLYGIALTKGSLSVVSVVGSLFPLTTVLLARGILGERLRVVQGVGVACALAGVALIAASG